MNTPATIERVRAAEPRLVAGSVVLVALGHLALLLVPAAAADLATIAGVEALVTVVFVAVAAIEAVSVRAFGGTVACVAGMLGVAGGMLVVTDAVVLAVLGTAGVFALLAYGLHRYELVALGLVEVPADA